MGIIILYEGDGVRSRARVRSPERRSLTLSWKRIGDTRCGTKAESNMSNFSGWKRGPARALGPGWCGSLSALGSKVRDYNIPGMPFRVHQFGTPVPSLRSSQPRARARDSLLPFLPALSRVVRSVPDEREAPWKRITLMPRAYARARENERTSERASE